MHLLGGLASVFGFGFVYFLGAIPTGAALGLPPWLTVIAAWLGYSAGAAVVIFAGEPLRDWFMRTLKIELHPAKPSLIKRAWDRFGLPAMGLLAPVTIGPQIGALMGIALRAPRLRLLLALSLGVLPWAIGFAFAVHFGIKLVR